MPRLLAAAGGRDDLIRSAPNLKADLIGREVAHLRRKLNETQAALEQQRFVDEAVHIVAERDISGAWVH